MTMPPNTKTLASPEDFETLWKNRPWWVNRESDKDIARYWYVLGAQHGIREITEQKD